MVHYTGKAKKSMWMSHCGTKLCSSLMTLTETCKEQRLVNEQHVLLAREHPSTFVPVVLDASSSTIMLSLTEAALSHCHEPWQAIQTSRVQL